jgi:hypothetical protein
MNNDSAYGVVMVRYISLLSKWKLQVWASFDFRGKVGDSPEWSRSGTYIFFIFQGCSMNQFDQFWFKNNRTVVIASP